jgi:hypothetical protein
LSAETCYRIAGMINGAFHGAQRSGFQTREGLGKQVRPKMERRTRVRNVDLRVELRKSGNVHGDGQSLL